MCHWIQIHQHYWKKQPERILPTGLTSKWPWGWNQEWDPPVKCSLEILKTPTSSGYVCVCVYKHAKLLDLYPTFGNPKGCSWPGSSVHGILQARTLAWVAMPSSRGSSWPRHWTCVSCGSCIASRIFTAEPPRKPLQAVSIIKIHRNRNSRSAVFKWW